MEELAKNISNLILRYELKKTIVVTSGRRACQLMRHALIRNIGNRLKYEASDNLFLEFGEVNILASKEISTRGLFHQFRTADLFVFDDLFYFLTYENYKAMFDELVDNGKNVVAGSSTTSMISEIKLNDKCITKIREVVRYFGFCNDAGYRKLTFKLFEAENSDTGITQTEDEHAGVD